MRIRFQGPWSLQRGWQNHLSDTPIVYRLRAWIDQAVTSRSVARAHGVDHEGVLDIGMSGHGYGRIQTFLRTCRTGRGSHAAANKFHDYNFEDAFPISTLKIEAVQLPSEELAEAVELALLEDYLYRFKDLPPLNSTAGNWRAVAAWLESLGREPRKTDGVIDLDGLIPLTLLGI
jgi:hypothetical protein